MNFNLSPELLEIQKKAREFALKEVLPVAAYYDEIGKTPIGVLRKAFDIGIINGDIPKKYGGKGYGVLESVVIVEEIAAACPGIATSVFDNSLGMEPLILSDNELAKEKYLPKIANDFRLISFATSVCDLD